MIYIKAKTRFIVYAAMVAAVYAAITVALAPISFGPLQLRVSEAMCVLPFFMPAAVPGLFIGCAISNMYGGFGLLDVVFGSAATLIAAAATYKIKNIYFAPLPSILTNAPLVGFVIWKALIGTADEMPFYILMAQIAGGQLLACYGLGLPLLLIMKKRFGRVFLLPGFVNKLER